MLEVYVYRLDNVPAFVPPGHGLVYLCALAMGRSGLGAAGVPPLLVAATVLVGGAVRRLGAVRVGPARTSSGAFWYLCLLGFLALGPLPHALRRRLRRGHLPRAARHLAGHLGLADARPDRAGHASATRPSGAAGGYGWFDLAAVLAGPAVLTLTLAAATRSAARRPSPLAIDHVKQAYGYFARRLRLAKYSYACHTWSTGPSARRTAQEVFDGRVTAVANSPTCLREIATATEVVSLRAMAHPVRLRMLSLLTGAPMSAAEVARELGLTHANASYHLRQLLAAGQLVEAGEESIRGGRAKRYQLRRRRARLDRVRTPGSAPRSTTLIADELLRRSRVDPPGRAGRASTDAELLGRPGGLGARPSTR